MPAIASSSPALLIAHVATHTRRIRLGAGGVMLPNHPPYVVAEQFGTLAEMHPGRIDLGLGRAPGTDATTLGRALRRDPHAAERFPADVSELQAYLAGRTVIDGVEAVPGAGTRVPLYILGSSLFGAQLAARLGLPYAFASHFAPTHLKESTRLYREQFRPSEALAQPYTVAAVNVTAADCEEDALRQAERVRRSRVRTMVGRGRDLSEEDLRALMKSYAGRQVLAMLRYHAVGTPAQVREQLREFQRLSGADELMISLQAPSHGEVLSGLDALARGWGLGREEKGAAPVE